MYTIIYILHIHSICIIIHFIILYLIYLVSGIIPSNLRHEETIVQIAEALDNLGDAVSYIFDCIDRRLLENTQR